MLCDNCGNHEANVKYTQIVNGVKKEMNLCSECAEKMGITQNMNFDMGMSFPSFLGSFLEDYNTNLLSPFVKQKENKCQSCGMTYGEFADTGMLGCQNCYDVFEDKMDILLKNLQGANRHIGKKGKLLKEKTEEIKKVVPKEKKDTSLKKIEELKKNLKIAIKEERYEDAAKLRDEIKKMEK